jgi:hypothetical protein
MDTDHDRIQDRTHEGHGDHAAHEGHGSHEDTAAKATTSRCSAGCSGRTWSWRCPPSC